MNFLLSSYPATSAAQDCKGWLWLLTTLLGLSKGTL
jgi:hypothetical protein